MDEHKIPRNRENYLELAFLGETPEELDPELTIHLDEIFRKAA